MLDSTASYALVGVLILAAIGAEAWRRALKSRRLVRRLQQRIADLERELTARPALRIAFEFRTGTREALLHVTNDGGEADVWAPTSIEGALTSQLEGEIRAAWQDAPGSTVPLRRGETRTLRVAQLDLSVFPYAQWQLYGINARGERVSVRAMHTSMIGGDPATHAPVVFIQVALVSSPDGAGAPAHCTIALRPFEAVRLGPV